MIENIYEQKSLYKLILIFGIPSILSLMIEMLTGIVDTAFAGNLPVLGDSALSAMALITPVMAIFTALQTLFAMSTGILIAKYLNNRDHLYQSFYTGVIMSLVMSVTISLICFLSLSLILRSLGATGSIYIMAKQYLQVQLINNIFSSVGYTLSCCIRAFGFPKIELRIITVAVLIDIIFNYIFAFIFKMGLVGLAWGTLVSEIVCALCCIIFLFKKKLLFYKMSLSVRSFFFSAYELFKIGIAQTAIQVLGGCTGFVVNSRLLTLGSMSHLASFNVVQRIYSFALMPIVGITQGVQNIISYFSGNGADEKISGVSKRTMLLCSIYGVVTLFLIIIFGQDIVSIFGGSYEVLTMAKSIILAVFIGFPFVGILYTDMTLLQVTKHEFTSVMLILSRQVFFLIPLVFIIPSLVGIFGLPVSPVIALFFSIPIADLLSVIFAILVKRKFCINSR
ncbi:MAG: MATE family efflux transporter [Erysipelotrichaceae bacterium]